MKNTLDPRNVQQARPSSGGKDSGRKPLRGPSYAPYGNQKGVPSAPLRFFGCPRREGLGLLDELRKTGGVAHGHVRQNLAVDRDSGRLQAVDQLAVGDAVQTSSGTDALNPQTAVLPLPDTAVALGITLRAMPSSRK